MVCMNEITLHGNWLVKAPLEQVFQIMTDFERWPEYFPKVATSVQVSRRSGNTLEIRATVTSFGQQFPVTMKTQILPRKGFISDNDSPKFGTSGHEELLLIDHPKGTQIDYTYRVTIHKRWLRWLARPLIGWFSMKYWQWAVIDVLRKKLEVLV